MLGLMGSLHCIGMCGPLAITFCNKSDSSTRHHLMTGISYNGGRLITYTLLGLVFGLFGSLFLVSGLQKILSITLGILMVLSFLFSINIDNKMNSTKIGKVINEKVQTMIRSMLNSSRKYPTLVLGMANGLLPCGLVYLALAGAISTGNLLLGMAFMFVFGLGTFPAMLTLTLGSNMVSTRIRRHFQRALPYATLGLGIFMIYRGIVVDVPLELDFWRAVKDPLMCH